MNTPHARSPVPVPHPSLRSRPTAAAPSDPDATAHDPAILARATLPHALVLRARGAALRRLSRRGRDLLLIPLEPLTLGVEEPDGTSHERRLRAYSLSWLPATLGARIAADGRAELLMVLVAPGHGVPGEGSDEASGAPGAAPEAPLLDVIHTDVGLLGSALGRLLARSGDAPEIFLPPMIDWLVARCVRERRRALETPPRTRRRAVPAGLEAEALEDTLDRIEEQLAEPVTVSALARALAMSDSSFSRAFKASMGASPSRYMRERRVARAQRLLETTDLPLAEITFETGFSSQSHMTCVFVRQLGVTPGQYRRSLAADASAPALHAT